MTDPRTGIDAMLILHGEEALTLHKGTSINPV